MGSGGPPESAKNERVTNQDAQNAYSAVVGALEVRGTQGRRSAGASCVQRGDDRGRADLRAGSVDDALDL